MTIVDSLVDMRMKFKTDGTRVPGYGIEWISVAIPAGTFSGLVASIEETLQVQIDRENFELTPDGRHMRTIASITKGKSPKFVELNLISTNTVQKTVLGTVGDIYESRMIDNVAGGVLGFGFGFTHICATDVNEVPNGELVKLKLKLLAVRHVFYASRTQVRYFDFER